MKNLGKKIMTIFLLVSISKIALGEFDTSKYEFDSTSFILEVNEWVNKSEMKEKEFLGLYEKLAQNPSYNSLKETVKEIYGVNKKNHRHVSNQSFVMSLHRLILRENPLARSYDREIFNENVEALDQGKTNRADLLNKYLNSEKAKYRLGDILIELKEFKKQQQFAQYKL